MLQKLITCWVKKRVKKLNALCPRSRFLTQNHVLPLLSCPRASSRSSESHSHRCLLPLLLFWHRGQEIWLTVPISRKMSCSPCSPLLCWEIYNQAWANSTDFIRKGLQLCCVADWKTQVGLTVSQLGGWFLGYLQGDFQGISPWACHMLS